MVVNNAILSTLWGKMLLSTPSFIYYSHTFQPTVLTCNFSRLRNMILREIKQSFRKYSSQGMICSVGKLFIILVRGFSYFLYFQISECFNPLNTFEVIGIRIMGENGRAGDEVLFILFLDGWKCSLFTWRLLLKWKTYNLISSLYNPSILGSSKTYAAQIIVARRVVMQITWNFFPPSFRGLVSRASLGRNKVKRQQTMVGSQQSSSRMTYCHPIIYLFPSRTHLRA